MNEKISEALALLAEGEDLNGELAKGAMGELMSGSCDPAQIGAFLMGLRVKGETLEEIVACAQVLREKSLRIHPKVQAMGGLLTDVCGTGGARLKTFNVSTLAAFVVAGAGVPVAKHGNRSVTGPCGSADLLEALGLNLEAPPGIVQRCIEEIGIGFLFAPKFHPAMRHAAPVRKALGIRTIFNLLGPLANPAGAQAHLMGVFDPHLVEIYPEVLRALGIKRALVVYGLDGLDELSNVGLTRVGELLHGKIRHYELSPEAFFLRRADPDELRALPPRESAKIALQLLRNKLHDARSEMLLLNAGAALYASGAAGSLEEGLMLAHESLKSGAAYEKLKLLLKRMR